MSIKPNNHTIGRLTQATSTHFDKLSDQGSVQATSSVTDFVYDKSGNNLHNNAKYDPKNNQLLEDDNYIYRYNKQGSLISKQDKSNNAATEYIYNKLNQLIKVKNQTQEISFTYNALNQRVTKSIKSTITGTTVSHRYLYHNDHIVAILNNKDNSLLATIIHHPNKTDTPLSITNHTTNQTYYYHRDHQGSIIALSNEYGDIVEEIVYDGDYGKIQKHTTKEPTLNPYGYTGREIDMNDLYYYRARYYDPHTQRFLSLDPIEFDSGDYNFYRYVGGDPVNLVDPSGLTANCPVSPPNINKMWKKYPGPPEVFHCGYDTYLENRNPSKNDPIAECVYDENKKLVDSKHKYKGCRGTPDQYTAGNWTSFNGLKEKWNHTVNDSGGIVAHGWEAFKESRSREWDLFKHEVSAKYDELSKYLTHIFN